MTPEKRELLLGQIEANVAAALLRLNRSVAIIDILENAGGLNTDRARETVARTRAVREAILSAGIRLPPPRAGEPPAPEMRDPEPEPARQGEDLTVSEIAKRTGLHRTTIVRHLRAASRELAERLENGQREGKAARFAPEEVELILQGWNEER